MGPSGPNISVLQQEACDCPEGECKRTSAGCIYLVARNGDVITQRCTACDAYTWHQNGECLRCKRRKRYPFPTPKSKSQLKRFLGMTPGRMKKWLAKHGDIPACPGCGVMAGPHFPGCPKASKK